MNMRTAYGMVRALFVALGLAVSLPAAAQGVNLAVPNAEVITPIAPAKTAWRVMNVDSFPRTVAAAVAQCQREANRDETDRLTLTHCDTFQRMLRASECSSVSVRDEQVYSALMGRTQTLHDAAKRIGRADLATRCNVGDGITLDWFNGQPGVSCFNVGVIIAPLPVEPAERVMKVPPKKKGTCQMVTSTQRTQPNIGLFLPAIYLPGCDCCAPLYTPSLWLSPQGSDTMTTSILVCS